MSKLSELKARVEKLEAKLKESELKKLAKGDLNLLDEELQIELVKYNPRYVKKIKNPSENVQLVATRLDWFSIKAIIENIGKDPSENVQLMAVKEKEGSGSSEAIKWIENPSETVQLVAVKEFGIAISDIKNPSEKVKLVAVNDMWEAIKYIKNPSENVQLAAILQKKKVTPYREVLKYIKNPSEKVKRQIIKIWPDVVFKNGNPIY